MGESLPLQSQEREEALPPEILGRLRQILMIDDDEFVCGVIASHLRSLCSADITVTHGDADTVKLLNEGGPFDLIVSDLSMPMFDGVQLMRLAAKRQSGAAYLFISSSGRKLLSAAKDLAIERTLHVLGIIEKPVTRKNLRGALLQLVAQVPARSMQPAADKPTVEELRNAIVSFDIEVYTQPQLYAATGKLYGVEALARWNSVKHGFVPPDVFVRMAEEHGLIDDLTDLILKKSLIACATWKKAGLETRISVNAPISSMSNLMLPNTITALIERYDLSPDQLTMELTETGFLNDQERALDVVTRLRLRHVGLSIDDFGCGHSTFKQLERMPFSELKIDCSFVMGMFNNPSCMGIVRSSLALAKDLEMHAVAEGVETIGHWDALSAMSCDVLQGYYIAKPFPAEKLIQWMKEVGSKFSSPRDLKRRG